MKTLHGPDAEIDAIHERLDAGSQTTNETQTPSQVAATQFAAIARRRAGRTLGRRNSQRVANETLLARARHLSDTDRALITARLGMGISLRHLAALHHNTTRQLRLRIVQISNTLSDPCFLLTTQFGRELPAPLAALARAYWIEGLTLRTLAQREGTTLHHIRREIGLARSLLLVALASRQRIPADLARATLMAGHAT